MYLTSEEERILNGEEGYAAQKAMQILTALGDIFGADKLIPVKSVQVAGVSYANLGDPGLEFLSELAKDGRVKVTTTLNPAGMDRENWRALGIPGDFANKQIQVIDAFSKMGINPTCTCVPYFIGNLPNFGDHVAWAESSAVTFVNSVIGARSNREGGPSALSAALVGKTPNYGLHLDHERVPDITFVVKAEIRDVADFGALGCAIGKLCENKIPYIKGLKGAKADELKSFSASVVTYGSKALFHIEDLTPESRKFEAPEEIIEIDDEELLQAREELNDPGEDIDFVFIGCPHASIKELEELSELLKGKKINEGVEFWVATARPIKARAEELGYAKIIEESGAKFACDTCHVVAPLKGRFKRVATTSAKGCYYARGRNEMMTKIGNLAQCVDAGVSGKWKSKGQ